MANATLLTFDGKGAITDETSASYQGNGDTYTQDGDSLTVGGGLFDLNSFAFNIYGGELITNLTALTSYAAGSHAVNFAGLSWAVFSPTSRNICLGNINVSISVTSPSALIY